jgi:AcrR family transcriptional regulator
MRPYFIEATREIIKGEGLRGVSVRSVADRAGYSYATLYNYFKDINALIFECVSDFQKECEDFVISETQNSIHGRQKIKDIYIAYIKYFIQYPGIFELFFLEKRNALGQSYETHKLIYTFLNRLSSEEWNISVANGQISSNNAELAMMEIKNLITGLLLFYLNRMQPLDYSELLTMATMQIEDVINNKL